MLRTYTATSPVLHARACCCAGGAHTGTMIRRHVRISYGTRDSHHLAASRLKCCTYNTYVRTYHTPYTVSRDFANRLPFCALSTELRADSEALEPRLEAPIIQFMIGFLDHTRTGAAYHRNEAIPRLWSLPVCLPLPPPNSPTTRPSHNPCVPMIYRKLKGLESDDLHEHR
jgi:hypothetical protein